MPAYRISFDYMFPQSTNPAITGSHIVVAVVDTPQGPSVFVSEVEITQTAQMEDAAQAYDSLVGIG